MQTSHATDQTQPSHSIHTAHHVNAQQNKINKTLELTKRSVFNPAGNTTPARLVIRLFTCASHAELRYNRTNTNFTQHPHRTCTAHHVNDQQNKIRSTLELTKSSVVNLAGNTAPERSNKPSGKSWL
jgi:hypothetical protein